VLGHHHGEIQNQRLSARKAREQLGWAPRFDLDTALIETGRWYKEFFDRKAACQ